MYQLSIYKVDTPNTITTHFLVTNGESALAGRTVKFTKSDKFKVYLSLVPKGKSLQRAIDGFGVANALDLGIFMSGDGVAQRLDFASRLSDPTFDRNTWDSFFGAAGSAAPAPQVQPVTNADADDDIVAAMLNGSTAAPDPVASALADDPMPVANDNFMDQLRQAMIDMEPLLDEAVAVNGKPPGWGEF